MGDNQEEKFLNSLGKRVAELRAAKSLTQEQLGTKSGIDWKHIGFIEQGRLRPTVRTAHRIAKGLGVSVDELFKGL